MGGFFGFLMLVLDGVVIWNVIHQEFAERKKIFWIALILLVPAVGVAFYYLLSRKKA